MGAFPPSCLRFLCTFKPQLSPHRMWHGSVVMSCVQYILIFSPFSISLCTSWYFHSHWVFSCFSICEDWSCIHWLSPMTVANCSICSYTSCATAIVLLLMFLLRDCHCHWLATKPPVTLPYDNLHLVTTLNLCCHILSGTNLWITRCSLEILTLLSSL